MVFTFRIYDKTSCERALGKKIIKGYIDLEWDSRTTYFLLLCSLLSPFLFQFFFIKMCFRFFSHKTKFVFQIQLQGKQFIIVKKKRPRGSECEHVLKASEETIGLSSEHTGCLITDPSGQSWLVGLSNGSQSGTRMSKGWAKFTLKTQLKAEDRVRFEVLSAKEKDSVMHPKMFKL